MSSAYENAMSDTQASNHAQKYPATSQRTCPVCSDRVVCNLRAGQWMLDYHHNKRAGYKKWCGGSDMNMSEAAQ